MSIVSNNIKYLRRLNGLTQEQFSRKIGIKRSLLGAYEEARANPNLTNLKNMAHAFGVSVDNLLKNDLRRLRETPDLGLPFSAGQKPITPLMREEATPRVSAPPQPLATIVSKFNPPKPSLRMVARPVTFKPVHQENFKNQTNGSTGTASEPMRFNNQYQDNPTAKGSPDQQTQRPQQTIQWVKTAQFDEYARQSDNQNYLNALPVFQLPTLPSGHYRAFEAGSDFSMSGALLVGTFVRNWYEIKDGGVYVLLVKQRGILIRRTVNLVKMRGILLLQAETNNAPELEVPIGDVQEVWEVKAFVSSTPPPVTPSYPKLKKILGALKDELNRSDAEDNFLD